MGKNYEGHSTLDMDVDAATRHVHEALAAMPKINVMGVWQGLVRASVPMSWNTWGEDITVSLATSQQGTDVRIRSECSNPLQLGDWGRNKKNVDQISRVLQGHGAATPY